MNEFAEVYLWGTRIGVLHLNGKTSIAAFEYDSDFTSKAEGSGIEPAPLMMPVSGRIFEFPDMALSFRGVPGMIADSLPDKFGNAVINKWLAAVGKTENDFNVIDRLCYTGKRGMGALEYVPALGPDPSKDDVINVSEMVRFATDILSKRQKIKVDASEELTYAGLLKLGTSAGGARAKAVVAYNEETGELRSGQIDSPEGFDHWIIKFDGVTANGDHGEEDAPEYTRIEYAYYLMAKDAGIDMEECMLLHENGREHFMTKRFDRINGSKLHMQTLAALAHIDYNMPGLCSYEQAVSYMRRIGMSAEDVSRFFRRMVFNVAAVNQDDHVKNVSFLMDRDGKWRLSPAYDVTFAYNADNVWLKAHQMSVNNKVSDITIDDLVSSGERMGLSGGSINAIIGEVKESVDRWETFAGKAGVSEKNFTAIRNIMKTVG